MSRRDYAWALHTVRLHRRPLFLFYRGTPFAAQLIARVRTHLAAARAIRLAGGAGRLP